ncbi:MAG: hypothetical protein KGJ78_02010 [Alphaproteobacteria bacterium]|nr:hypothetical protein [Alphaproteobacteria bacterium]
MTDTPAIPTCPAMIRSDPEMVEPETAELDLAAARLAEQLDACHEIAMRAYEWVKRPPNWDTRLRCITVATRMMTASAAATMTLKRLKSDGTRHTVTVLRGEPPRKKSKTNGAEPDALSQSEAAPADVVNEPAGSEA